MRPTDSPVAHHRHSPRPPWNEVLRALREARGITQAGWAVRLGVSRRTVLRWERGERVPDTGAEAGILIYCSERGLLRAYDRGPLSGVTLSAELLQEMLAEARWHLAVGRSTPPMPPSQEAPLQPVTETPRFVAPRWRQPPLVGRDRELSLLTERLNAAAQGTPGVVLLSGEPGVGKTRLLSEIVDRASDGGWQVLVGSASGSEGMPPYVPFVEALRHYVHSCPVDVLRSQLGEAAADMVLVLPEITRRLPDPPTRKQLDPESDRYRLFDSFTAFIAAIAEASANGLLLCLDDLHWADDSTLLLLEHLCRQLDGTRLLILATFRSTELDPGHPLSRTLEYLIRLRVSQRIDLEPLDRDGVRMLLMGLGQGEPPPPLVDAVYFETEGNPFFVQEVFEYLVEQGRLFDSAGQWRSDIHIGSTDVPDSIRLVIGRRLERLSAECRRMLGLAAVLGRTLEFNLLRACSELREERLLTVLEEAEQAQLLISDDRGRLTFGHELIRQTLLSGLTALRRQRLYLQAAEATEQLYAATIDTHLAEIADRYCLAGTAADPTRVVDYAARAGDRALQVFAYAESIRLFNVAIATITTQGDQAVARDLLVDLHRKSAQACRRLTRWAEARHHLEAALDLLQAAALEERCGVLIELVLVCRMRVDLDAGQRYAEEARALAERLDRPDLQAVALGAVADVAFYNGDVATSAASHRIASHGLKHADPSVATSIENGHAQLLYLTGRYGESVEHGQRAVVLARECADMAALTHALGPLGLALAATGRYQEAEQAFTDAREVGTHYGIDRYRTRAACMSTTLHLDLFDFEGALRQAQEATELAQRYGVYPAEVSAALDTAAIDLRRGESGRAIELLPWIRERVAYANEQRTALHGWLWPVRLAQVEAEVALARRDWREAALLATASIEASRARMRPKYASAALATRGQALVALGQKTEALADLTAAVEVARGTADPALFVRMAAAMLRVEPSTWLVDEAQNAVVRVRDAVVDPRLRRCFEDSEAVQFIGHARDSDQGLGFEP